jgi:predicted unusual protein kinase regulating ubiquinone biosynthesis (AarF/ABC1/UbiB family)
MDFVSGKKVTAISPLRQIELDGSILAEEVFKAYLKQILVDGFFHADPHPGNVLLTNDNRIALIDLGMVARLTQPLQEKLLQLLMAISESRPDAAADVIFAIGEPKDDFDATSCRKGITEVAQNVSTSNIEQMQIGTVVLGIIKVCGDNGLRLPAQLTMLGKTLLNLDQVGRTLDPKFDPNASVRRNASHIMQQRMLKSISPSHMLAGLVEAKEFADKMPARVNKILDLVANNKLRMKVDTIDETLIIDACQKIANRITIGLVLGALIVGAALLMRVQTDFTILGYPGLAIICFLFAACGGCALVVHIAFYDQKPQKLAK